MNFYRKLQSDFTTPRLVLTSLTLADDEFIFTLVNSPGWLRFVGDRNVRSIDDAGAYIKKINENPAIKYWMVALRHDKTPIGIITYIKRDYLELPDLGFAFLPSYTRNGYAFEAASVILDYLSISHLSEGILATTVPGNIDSIRLLEKLGFAVAEDIEVDGQTLLTYALMRMQGP